MYTKRIFVFILTLALLCGGCTAHSVDVPPETTLETPAETTSPTEITNPPMNVVGSEIIPEESELVEETSPPSDDSVVVDEKPIVDKKDEESTANSETSTTQQPVAPAVNFEAVEQTVWAVSDVNIRVGPGTNYDRIESLTAGESVLRIGIGDNGWSKVVYDNVEAFIHSNYLSTSEPQQAPVQNDPIQDNRPVTYLTPCGPYARPDYSIYDEYETQIIKTVLEKINENKNNPDIHEENIAFEKDISFNSYYKVASFFYVYYGQKRAVDETFDFVRSGDTDENGNRTECYLRLRYDDIRQFENDMSSVRYKVDSILCGLEDGSEKYILKQIAEYLRTHMTYTYGKYSVQNALLEGQSVCNGYALAFNMLANRAGIRSDLCIGLASNGENHAWNRVILSDGSQYFYDITWYDGNNGPNNRYIHSSSNFHGAYSINDYSGCWLD